MKNVDELYKKYYNDYKSDFDTNNELTENKKKKCNFKNFELDNIISTKSDKLKLLKWIKVSKTRFNEILSIITEAKNNGLKVNVDGEEITLDKAESLLKGINSKKVNIHEFREKYNDIVKDVEKILTKQPLSINEKDMIKILSLLWKLTKSNDKKKTTDEQSYTTNKPELESEESAEQGRNQQRKGLKILTPNQILYSFFNYFSSIKSKN